MVLKQQERTNNTTTNTTTLKQKQWFDVVHFFMTFIFGRAPAGAQPLGQ
jgi:hypothetical protein